MAELDFSLTASRLTLARITALMGVLGLALIVAVSAILAWTEYRNAFQRAEDAAAADAFFLADHAGRLFEVADIGLNSAASATRDLSWDTIATSPELHRQLRNLAGALPQVEDVWLNDQAGLLRATSFALPAPYSMAADRENFKAAEAGESGRRMFIGPPIVGKVTQRPTFLLSRRLENADGTFRGMVSVTAELNYFKDYWSRLSLPFDPRVTLFRAESMEVLARHPPLPGTEPLKVNAAVAESLARDPIAGIVRAATTGPEGYSRFGAYRRVGDLPLYVGVSFARESVLQAWRSWLTRSMPLPAAAFLGLAGLTVVALRQARREAEDKRALMRARADLAEANQGLIAEIQSREAAEAQLRQSQKMEAVGQLTGGVAHDFNNMLAIVIGALNLLQRRLARGQTGAETLERYVEAAMEGATRAVTLTQRLLAFARQQPLNPEPVDANKLVAGMSELLRRTLGEAIRIETVLAGGLWRTHADASQLENALLNLAVNARDAMREGAGRLTVETANCFLDEAYAKDHAGVPPGQYVLIAVTDTGAGMPTDVMARAFDPFFTTKGVGQGTGLGLSQVYGFVKQSGGHVKIYSEADQGTTVKLYLPRWHSQADPVAAMLTSARNAAPPVGNPHEIVLVVEDEERVRRFSVEALRDLGYTVVHAEGGASALDKLAAHPDIALLFTDVVMPDMNGRKLADEAIRRRPDLKVLFTTGYTRNAVVHNGMLDPGTHLINKPFTVDQLAGKVREVLER